MPALTFTSIGFALSAAAALVVGACLCAADDDDNTPHNSYHSSSLNSGTSRIRTQPSYRPPPLPPSYTRSPAIQAQTTPRTSAPPDYGRGFHKPTAASPYTRAPSQTQAFSTLIRQQSSPRTQPSVAQPTSTSSRIPPRVPTERDRLLPTVYSGYHSSVVPPSTRTPSQKQTSTTFAQLPSTRAQPSTVAQPPRPYSSLFDHIRSASTISRVPSCVPTERDPFSPTVIQVVSSDEPTTVEQVVEDLDFAKKLREQARRKGREMSDARSRAKSAQKNGSRGAAQEHKQRSNAHQSAMKAFDKRAAKIIFKENNKNLKEGTVDLHGLYVAEAVQFAKEQVQAARSRGDKDVRFIVGKGLHSDDGEAKIRPALEVHFTKQGLTHLLDPRNAGVLIVRLD